MVGNNIGTGNDESMSSALGKATEKTLQQIISDVQATTLLYSCPREAKGRARRQDAPPPTRSDTPGKVCGREQGRDHIALLGSKPGFQGRRQTAAFQTNDVKDDKGNVVFTDEKRAGNSPSCPCRDAPHWDHSRLNLGPRVTGSHWKSPTTTAWGILFLRHR